MFKKNKFKMALVMVLCLLIAVPVASVFYEQYFANVLIRKGGFIDFAEGTSAVATPPSGVARIGAYNNGFYLVDDAGTSTDILTSIRYVHLPLKNWAIETGGNASTVGSGFTEITTSTAPGYELDDKVFDIVWADGELSPVQQTFTVPADYSSAGSFLGFFTESDSTTPNQVDFDVYINRSGQAADSAATGQTPVALVFGTSTPSQITLTVATDFTSLVAGDRVTLRLWRDNVAAGTGDLEMKSDVIFSYIGKN